MAKKNNIVAEVSLDGTISNYNAYKKKKKNNIVAEVDLDGNINKYTSTKSDKKNNQLLGGLFQSSKSFNDGYQFGDITNTITSTTKDLASDIGEGFLSATEGIGDWLQYRTSDALNLVGAKDAAQAVKENAKFNSTAAIFGKNENDNLLKKGWTNKFEENSVLGDTFDAINQGIGQVGAMAGMSAIMGGNVAGSALTSYTSAYGNAKSNAYLNGADDKTANKAAMIGGFSEAIAEQFFNGLPGLKTAGWGEGLVGKVAGGVEKALGTTAGKIFTKVADAAGEGAEEIISNVLTATGNDIAHFFDKNYDYGMENQTGNIFDDIKNAAISEDSIKSFFTAAMTSALIGGGNTILNSSQKNIILKEYAKNNNITYKEAKNMFENTVKAETEANSTNLPFNKKMEVEEKINKQELQNMKRNIFVEQGQKDQAFKYNETDNEQVNNMFKSLSEKGNNTVENHAISQMAEKLIKDFKYDVEFTNNEELKAQGKAENAAGYKEGNKIVLNIDSNEMASYVMGHETTHFLENEGELYDAVSNAVYELATTKGVHEDNLASIKKTYANFINEKIANQEKELGRNLTQDEKRSIEDSVIKSELTANYVGSFFTDEDFFRTLGKGNPSRLQQFSEFLKGLYYKVTGQEEKAQILKAQQLIRKVYAEYTNGSEINTINSIEIEMQNKDITEQNNEGNINIPTAQEISQEQAKTSSENVNLPTYNNEDTKYLLTQDVETNNDFANNSKKEYNNDIFATNMELSKVKEGDLINEFKDSLTKKQWYDYHKKMNKIMNSTYGNLNRIDVIGGKLVFTEIKNHKEQVTNVLKVSKKFYDKTNYIIKEANNYGYSGQQLQDIIENSIGKENVSRYNPTTSKFERTSELGENINGINEDSRQSNRKTIQGKNIGINSNEELNNSSFFSNNNTQYMLTEDNKGRKLTKEQQEFYKDSAIKVVNNDYGYPVIDPNGQLFEVYHGTNNDSFTEFNNQYIGSSNDAGWYGRGFYFAFSEAEAKAYGNNVLKAYLNIKNPFNYTDEMQMFRGKYTNNVSEDFGAFMINLSDKFTEIADNNTINYTDWEYNEDGTQDVKKMPISQLAKEIENVYDSPKLRIIEVSDMGQTKYQYIYNDDVRTAPMSEDIRQLIMDSHIVNKSDVDFAVKERKYYPNLTDEQINKLYDFYNETGYNFQTDTVGWTANTREELESARLGYATQVVTTKIHNYVDMHMPEVYMESFGVEISDKLKEMGYDGVIQSSSGDEIVAFYPNQIKSVDNQNPTDNNDIRYMLTPAESKSNKDSDGYELSKEQLNFFKNSKATDEKGNLKVLYHGTLNYDFNEFEGGTFLTDDYFNADGYASGERIIEAYANITNPLVIDAKGRKWDNLDTPYGTSTREIVGSLDESKYDGVIFENINDNWIDDEDADVGTVYYVPNSNQIKNTDNTNPTSNPDIRYMLTEDNKGKKLSNEQREYFKDSKVRDEEGKLLTLYNGSGNHTTYNPGYMSEDSLWGKGIYLTKYKDIASNYGNDVKEVYANITKPIGNDKNLTFEQYNDLYKSINDGENADIRDFELYDNDYDLLWDVTNGNWADYAEELKKYTGYDGLIINPEADRIDEMIIAFQSNQIKNVDNLKPTEEDDIRYLVEDSNDYSLYNPKNKLNTKLSDMKIVENLPVEEINIPTAQKNNLTNENLEKPTRRQVIDKNRELAREQLGDITRIKDKKKGILYQINTMKRNLRDIMSPEQAKAMYDTYFKPITENNAEIEKDITSYNERVQKYNLSNEESVYTQMLGEYKYNPETRLTADDVNNYYLKHSNKIDKNKVENAINEFRNIYDELIGKINETLTDNGYKEIEYRKGYFPHFIEEKAISPIGKLAEKLGWKIKQGTLPTDIAGITDQFKPGKVWTSFSQQRTGDATDYNALKGLDNYIRGAMDVIHHTNDIQKLRALENEIRYQYSSKGIQEKIDSIYADETLDMEEKNDAIYQLTTDISNSSLGNFATEIRNYTDNLANKKSFSDRRMEQSFGRDTYSIMQNINSRVSANMVGANISSALTNFIPITQAWSQVSTKNLMRGMYESIKTSIKDDGFANNSVYLTNRTKQANRLFQTGLEKLNNKLGIPFEAIDSFTSNTIVRAKYYENLEKGMSEQEAISNADEFAKDVMAGRSKGDMPTIMNVKNPITKLFTAFQLEVNNQYGYMFKDIKADLGDEAKEKIAAAFVKMFFGAWLYNYFAEKITGRKSAFSPIDMAIDDIKTATNENLDLGDKISTIATDIAQEMPFVGGIMGGGRLPIQGAIPYENPLEMVTGTIDDASKIFDGDKTKKRNAIKKLKKEWSKPLYYIAMPFAGGQIKKTVEGLSMYDENLPIAGSYTDSGKLRFEADTSPLGKLQAAVFGQYASENAREYFDKKYTPLTEKQINTALDSGLGIDEFREYNSGIKAAKKQAKENGGSQTEAVYDYIDNLPLANDQKNSLLNSTLGKSDTVKDNNGYIKYVDKKNKAYWLDEETNILYNKNYHKVDISKLNELTQYSNKKDMSDYGNYDSLDEFNYANNNPQKYIAITQVTDYGTYNEYKDYIEDISENYSEMLDNATNSKQRTAISNQKKNAIKNYINSLNLNKYQKTMLYKLAGGYSIKNYAREMHNYIDSLELTAEEKQTIYDELFN